MQRKLRLQKGVARAARTRDTAACRTAILAVKVQPCVSQPSIPVIIAGCKKSDTVKAIRGGIKQTSGRQVPVAFCCRNSGNFQRAFTADKRFDRFVDRLRRAGIDSIRAER